MSHEHKSFIAVVNVCIKYIYVFSQQRNTVVPSASSFIRNNDCTCKAPSSLHIRFGSIISVLYWMTGCILVRLSNLFWSAVPKEYQIHIWSSSSEAIFGKLYYSYLLLLTLSKKRIFDMIRRKCAAPELMLRLVIPLRHLKFSFESALLVLHSCLFYEWMNFQTTKISSFKNFFLMYIEETLELGIKSTCSIL